MNTLVVVLAITATIKMYGTTLNGTG